MKLRVHAATDVGLVRDQNEDAFLVDAGRACFAVADGLGGMPGGEVASQAVIGSLRQQLEQTPVDGPLDLARAIALAHAAARSAGRDFGPQGAGTTLTLAQIRHDRAYIGHVGDSFALLVRNGKCRALTREHNIENERSGEVDLTRYPQHYRYALTRVVGTTEPVRPEFYEETLQPGDRLVLATDGLTDMIDLADIGAIVERSQNPEHVVTGLLAAALEAGGRDNITVIVIEAASG